MLRGPQGRAARSRACWRCRMDHGPPRRAIARPGVDQLIKTNPLFDWARDRVVAYVRDRGIPYNPLHDRGFLSIGCEPCTRAVAPGKPERAGRWWWEQEEKKECGLHLAKEPNGRNSSVPVHPK